ncbi:RagB/SusD family nutrient uptake outer membrane protein [Sphingobacterium ginsenosidimutans]|uniref:RagB/SusD family nutrient uptake outer membrane protein n=1 Tax=Sphingobacterium ginsenosidimutans TaxID=687845 RepID=A0ABP8AM99_9SPHI
MKNKIIIPLLFIAISLASCNKWLDVKPEDKFIEEEVFKTPAGFYDALNGIYLNLGSNNLYGREINLETLDILAQTYYISTSQSDLRKQLVIFNYGDKGVKEKIDNIWTNLYVNITNINRFLENLDTYGSVLDEQTLAMMRGEALAARAFIYFDLLRMFAPAYTLDPESERIPYYKNTSYEAAPYSKSSYVLKNILGDLQIAENLLQKFDPVLSMDKVDQTTGAVELGSKPFLQFRNYHFNYFAIKGLQARIQLYAGDKTEALKAAEIIIASKNKFPWIQSSDLSNTSIINRIFSKELLFAFENPKLYRTFDELFNPALEDRYILCSGTTNKFLNTVYENWENDYRYSTNWRTDGGKTYPVFYKYRDIENNVNRNYRYTVPGIRLSEIFLIAAESEQDPIKALAYLNELRINRNCNALPNEAGLLENIKKEYRKEFYGEGQLWYYYKRNNVPTINGATTTNKTMVADNFTFPIPLSETEPR